jgi:predicted Zn-dependent protease with MMP-like domain
MNLSQEQFEAIVVRTIDELPERFQKHLNNVALFVEDFPTKEQMRENRIRDRYGLLGLFEGYGQASRLDYGAVLPDRITIFRRPIMDSCENERECADRIARVVRHEIAHHFGLGEKGARRAESPKKGGKGKKGK